MRGSISARGPDTWRLTVSHGIGPTGARRRTTKTVHGDRPAAEAELARLLVAVDEGKHNAAPGTLSWLAERWWEANSGNWTPNTVSTQHSVLYGHIVPHLGATRLRQLKTADIDMLYGRLRRAGLSAGTIGRVHVVLRSMLNQAVRWGDLGVNPALSARPPAVGRPDPRPPAKEELQKIATTVLERDPDFHCFLRLAGATGARRGELCALTWADLDLERCSIVINKALPSSGPLKPGPTKTKRGRRFKLDAGTVAILLEHKARMTERAEAAGAKLGPYVFSNYAGGIKPWHPSSVSHRLKRHADRVGVKTHLHAYRDYHASHLLAAGTDVRTVAERLGHARPSTTLDIYAAFIPAADDAAAGAAGASLD